MMLFVVLDIVQLDVHPTTITRQLKKQGIRARRAARKLALNDNHIHLRFVFSELYDNLDDQYWTDATLISDETSVG